MILYKNLFILIFLFFLYMSRYSLCRSLCRPKKHSILSLICYCFILSTIYHSQVFYDVQKISLSLVSFFFSTMCQGFKRILYMFFYIFSSFVGFLKLPSVFDFLESSLSDSMSSLSAFKIARVAWSASLNALTSFKTGNSINTVSYTHLTLPTILLV